MHLLQDIQQFIKNNPRPLIVLLGATASGKTAASLKIAKAINGEIISTDSRQIYREMTISTDALPPEEQEGIPHHMLEIRDPDQTLTLAEYKDMALKIIDEIYQRGHIPMLVGGTGLYTSAITEGYQVPRIPPNPRLRAQLEKEDNETLHQKLTAVDPRTAAHIHQNNRRYVIRALEINAAGKPKVDQKQESPFQAMMIGIERPREEIYQRIEARVDEQIKGGLIEEVKKLLEKGYDPELPSMSSLGVKEIIPYIKGEQTLEEVAATLKQNTRNYAKRQMTWSRRYNNVLWLTPEQITASL